MCGRSLGCLLALAIAWAPPLAPRVVAQEAARLEVGTSLAATVLRRNGVFPTTETFVQFPGSGVGGRPGVFTRLFLTKHVGLVAEGALTFFRASGTSTTTVSAGGGAEYLMTGTARRSLYIAGDLALRAFSTASGTNGDTG